MPHAHNFDPVSGWCGCGYRDDGRLINKQGVIYRQAREKTTRTTNEQEPTT